MNKTARLLRNVALPAIPALLLTPAAKAQVIYTDVGGITVTAGGERVFFDLGTGGGTGSAAVSGPGFAGDDFYLGFRYDNSAKPDIGKQDSNQSLVSGSYAINNALNDSILSGTWNGSTYASINYNNGNNANWAAGTSGYLGLRLDAGGGDYNYGWAQISYNANSSMTLHDFAYEQTVNTAILAGDMGATAVPEPSTYAGLAGLLAGCAALFKRRRIRVAA